MILRIADRRRRRDRTVVRVVLGVTQDRWYHDGAVVRVVLGVTQDRWYHDGAVVRVVLGVGDRNTCRLIVRQDKQRHDYRGHDGAGDEQPAQEVARPSSPVMPTVVNALAGAIDV